VTAIASHIHDLVELWSRRADPSTDDVRRALEVARALNGNSSSPTALRSLAWRVLREIHDAAGWQDPDEEPLPLCTSAAASARQTNTLLMDEVLREIRTVDLPVLVTGTLGASRSLFGRWDVLPANGVMLVTLGDQTGPGETLLESMYKVRGVRWANPPAGLRDLALSWPTVTLRDRQVRVPSADLLTVCAGRSALRAEDCETLVFCAAAFGVAGDGRWSEIENLAAAMDAAGVPTQSALRLGLDEWLHLDLGSARRLGVSLKRLFVAPVLRRHGKVPSDRLP